MGNLPAIFDFDGIRKQLSKLQNPAKDSLNEDIKTPKRAKDTKTILWVEKKPAPRKRHNFTKNNMIGLIDMQISMSDSMPTSKAMWQELKQFVDEGYDWWHDDN